MVIVSFCSLKHQAELVAVMKTTTNGCELCSCFCVYVKADLKIVFKTVSKISVFSCVWTYL